MKKTFEGKFCDIYDNDCEAVQPLGVEIENEEKTLCAIIKDLLEIQPDAFDSEHKFLNKKVKITIEIEE